MTTVKNETLVKIPVHDVTLEGELIVPEGSVALVIFSHGSGSSRLSPRNNYVAEKLRESNLGTLLFDLLTEDEDRDYSNRFDIDLLTKRLIVATKWALNQSELKSMKVGYFGASTGAASALRAASNMGDSIHAVVSRGGRPDLAMAVLHKVTAPTLLIVGGKDYQVIELNKEAFDKLMYEKRLEIVEGATHLFEEPGKLEEVAQLASEWFSRYLK